MTPATATKPGDKARSGNASLISRFFIDSMTHKNAPALSKVLINSTATLTDSISLNRMAKKKGIEQSKVTNDTIKEKSKASIENNTFFSETAEAAENKAEINASMNQFISVQEFLPSSY